LEAIRRRKKAEFGNDKDEDLDPELFEILDAIQEAKKKEHAGKLNSMECGSGYSELLESLERNWQGG
jgi:hypothetical protein